VCSRKLSVKLVRARTADGTKTDRVPVSVPNKSVGFTTVGEIRIMGYEVLRTSGEAHHATVVVPEDWTTEAATALALVFRLSANPAPKKRSRQ
jgi:hypothetical protein